MIVDSSAIVAILLVEPGHELLEARIERAGAVSIGAPTLLECAIVLCGRLGSAGQSVLSRFVEAAEIQQVAFDDRHYEAATHAFLRYGKGRHRAGLNYADCMTYAVAKAAGEPLLCVGDDFAETDLKLVG